MLRRNQSKQTVWKSSAVYFWQLIYAQTCWWTDWLTEQGLTSHQTHSRSYRERFLQVIWPNQQCQSTEGSQLVFQIRLESMLMNVYCNLRRTNYLV